MAMLSVVVQLGHLQIGGKSDPVHSNTVMSPEVEFIETSLFVEGWT